MGGDRGRIVSHGQGNPGTEGDRTHTPPTLNRSHTSAGQSHQLIGGALVIIAIERPQQTRATQSRQREDRSRAQCTAMDQMLAFLAVVHDPRRQPSTTLHTPETIRTILGLATIGGRRMGWRAPPGGRPRRRGLRRFWTCPRGFRPTLRVGASLPGSTRHLQPALVARMKARTDLSQDRIALDGKPLRRSLDRRMVKARCTS